MESLPRAEADSSEVMVMFQGERAQLGGGVGRVVAVLSGTCYMPKVCDLALCEFSSATDERAPDLPIPCLVRLSTRACRVSDRFNCFDIRTSSEFALLLDATFSNLRLFKLSYFVDLEVDGSLCWSRLTGATDLGNFWEAGQKKPWSPQARGESGMERDFERQRRTLKNLKLGDPFAEVQDGPAPTSSRRQAYGATTAASDARASHAKRARYAAASSSDTPALVAMQGAPTDGPSALVELGDGGEGVMDLVDDERADLDDDDLMELAATYAHELGPPVSPAGIIADVEERVAESLVPETADPDTVRAVGAEVEQAAQAAGLGEQLEEVEASGAGAGIAPTDAPPAEKDLLPPPAREPWELMSEPSASGYLYFEGRSVMRIQRGKPTGRLTLTCFRHPGCNLLINLPRAPNDLELKKWLFEVEPAPAGASMAERQALAKRHVQLARARWTARLTQPGGATESGR